MASGADVANAALAEKREIGGAELPNTQSGNKYCAWYGMDGYWCAMFVSYVCAKAGVPESVVPKYSYCPNCISWARKAGRLHSKPDVTGGSYTPQPGDIFLREGHTGIIVSVAGNEFTTVEGNTGGSGSGRRTVGSHTWTFSGGSYDYIFNPAYPDGSGYAAVLAPLKEEVIEVPSGLGRYYTYMNWDAITNLDTLQGKLIKAAGKNYDSEGYGRIGNRYTLAMTSTFGTIGDYVDVYMSNGRVIHGIIADEKAQVVTPWDPDPANIWGHDDGQCIVEWVTNWTKHENPPSDGTVLKVVNLGSYFDYPQYASGSVESYMYSQNAYTDGETEPTVAWNNRVKECIQPRLLAAAAIPSAGELRLYAEGSDVTAYMGGLNWKNSIKELATTLEFEIARSDTKYIEPWLYIPQLGDVVQLVTNAEIFRGVVISVDDGERDRNKYTAADLGWYLNKTAQTYQFKNVTGKTAVEEICEDLSIPIAAIPELGVRIKQIYFDKAVSEIISDILDRCGGTYNYDFTPEGLRIYEIGELRAYPEFRLAGNLAQDYSVKYRGNVSHSMSIENMKNSVKVTSEKDNLYSELIVQQNRELISKYGFLQEIIKIDPEKEDARITAGTALAEKGAVSDQYAFTIVEKYDSYTRAGEVIEIDGSDYVIESTNHSYSSGVHKTQLDVYKQG